LQQKNGTSHIYKQTCDFSFIFFLQRSSGGKLVDASPETEKSLTDELEKLARQYGAKGVDFTKFPTFNFAGNYKMVNVISYIYIYWTNPIP